MKKILVITLIFSLLQPVLPLLAQEESPISKTSLGVDPAIVEVILEAGKQEEKIIHVNNFSSLPLPVKALKQTFAAKEIANVPEEKLSIFDASSWLELNPEDEDFILQPQETKEIVVKFNPPENASPGGHYASLIFQPLIPQELVSNQSVFVYARVAVLVFMQVRGDIQQNLEYSQINIEPIYNELPLKISASLQNKGNTHLRPEGKVVIFNELTRTVVNSVEIIPSIILPEISKEYPVNIENLDGWGRYSVQFFMNYGDDHTLLTSDKFYFTVFPYKSLAVGMLVLIVLYLIFFRLRKRIRKAGKVLFESNEPTLFTTMKKNKSLNTKDYTNKLNLGKITPVRNKIFSTLPEKKFKLHSSIEKKNTNSSMKGTLKKKNLFTHLSIDRKTWSELQKEAQKK